MAVLYPVGTHPLLTPKFWSLADDTANGITKAQKQSAYNELAEAALGLVAPALTDAAAVAQLKYAVVLTINLMLQEGIEPHYLKSVSNDVPANTTTYRDRWVDPLARQLVEQVTGVRTVRLTPRGPNV